MIVAKVPYLNCEPFYRHLKPGPWSLFPTVPRVLGDLAQRGRLVAGPASLVDSWSLSNLYEPLGDLCIAVRKRAGSVVLFSKKTIAQLQGASVGVTAESVTSVELLKVLFALRYEIPLTVHLGTEMWDDAHLLIGDAALKAKHFVPMLGQYPYLYDLGEEWWNWKRLPFVFAVWMTQKSLPEDFKEGLRRALEDSVQKSLMEVPRISQEKAVHYGCAPEHLENYLSEFTYHLGPQEVAGMEEFQRLMDTGRKKVYA